MPRRDRYHYCVRRALIKDGWNITHDPFTISHENLHVYIDLGAAYTGNDRQVDLVIEVKVFAGGIQLPDFECAVGQYDFYRTMLLEAGIEREIYLALSQSAWREAQEKSPFLSHFRRRKIHWLIFDEQTEEVLQWIKQPN